MKLKLGPHIHYISIDRPGAIFRALRAMEIRTEPEGSVRTELCRPNQAGMAERLA